MKKISAACVVFVLTMAVVAIDEPAVNAYAGVIPAESISETVLINKAHPLRPIVYEPPMLVVPPVLLAKPAGDPEMQLDLLAAGALFNLFRGAQLDGISLVLSSGYRSYNDQALLYAAGLNIDGLTVNEAVAPPGHSEHQSGLAADVILSNYFCAAQGCFALSKAADWLNQNAFRYGFIIRYPLHKEAITGYEYEPWHLRYVGLELAGQLHVSGQTLEEFYGLP